MINENIEPVEQIIPENTEPVQEEVTETAPVAEAQEGQAAQADTPAARNFRALSQAKKKLEQEREQLLAKIRQYETVKPVEPEDEYEEPVTKEIKALKQEFSQYKQQMTITATEAQLKRQYSDFEEIVNSDNIAILREMHPELASTLNASPDIYSKAVAAYTMIKNLGIASRVEHNEEAEKISKNLSKPKPASSIAQSNSPLAQASLFSKPLTEETKQEIYKLVLERSK